MVSKSLHFIHMQNVGVKRSTFSLVRATKGDLSFLPSIDLNCQGRKSYRRAERTGRTDRLGGLFSGNFMENERVREGTHGHQTQATVSEISPLCPHRYHKGSQTGTAATLQLLPVGREGPRQPGQLLVALDNTL